MNEKFTMKTSLDHLPPARRAWIQAVADGIRDIAPVEMIILYGSYARGDYVEDPIGRSNNEGGPGNGTFPYYSDLDFCVITEKLRHARKIEQSETLFRRASRPDDKMPLSVIAHTWKQFKKALDYGEYFYVDIVKEGVLLHDSGNHSFKRPRNLTDEERKENAEEKLKYWTTKADDFMEFTNVAIERGKLDKAAFFLHQAAESYLSAAALFLTGYRPRGHELKKLEEQCVKGDATFHEILPRTSKEDRRIFNLLQSAYVDARYEMNFSISPEDLAEMKKRVESLRTRVGGFTLTNQKQNRS